MLDQMHGWPRKFRALVWGSVESFCHFTDRASGSLLKPRKLRFDRQAGTSSSIVILEVRSSNVANAISASVYASAAPMQKCVPCPNRSEERRVGKERRSRRSPYH